MKLLVSFALFAVLYSAAASQIPMTALLEIIKAEDARRYDSTLENLMKSPNPDVRKRAALAAGRVGNDAAVPALAVLLENDASIDVQIMAAFALGETESINAADAILSNLRRYPPKDVRLDLIAGLAAKRARLVEAAGKVAAANPKDRKSVELGSAILEVLNAEYERTKVQDTPTVRLALTAVLRARPDGADKVVTKFLTNLDAGVRADAANTMARLKSKAAAETLRKIVASDADPVARANAARALGTMVDKDSLNELLSAAIEDADPRVRVSGIRALANLSDPRAARHLIDRGGKLLRPGNPAGSPKPAAVPLSTNELLEIATTLGRLLAKTEDEKAVIFLNEFRMQDDFVSPETEIALARVAPKAYLGARLPDDFGYRSPRRASAYAQGLAAVTETKDANLIAQAGEKLTTWVAGMAKGVRPADQRKMLTVMPDITRAMAALKPDNLNDILLGQLKNEDVFVRAAAAELIAEQPYSDENADALNDEFDYAWKHDVQYNDAVLATMDALYKLDKQGKRGSVTAFILATSSPDQLVRIKALSILKDDAYKNKRDLQELLGSPAVAKLREVRPYSGKGKKMGQLLNTDADYRHALARKNGSVKAVLTTEKGTFTIDFFPEESPLTVDNFIKLARAGYFNGVEVHRVVPNFVMQDGDPRGDGNGGPGWSIRCEINMLPYDRGAVGMALSGKDTGGSQWFVTHSPQPHLDGGYTVFGRVNETGMKVVDNIARGDRILSVRIIGR